MVELSIKFEGIFYITYRNIMSILLTYVQNNSTVVTREKKERSACVGGFLSFHVWTCTHVRARKGEACDVRAQGRCIIESNGDGTPSTRDCIIAALACYRGV